MTPVAAFAAGFIIGAIVMIVVGALMVGDDE
jgi:hypothetical protein